MVNRTSRTRKSPHFAVKHIAKSQKSPPPKPKLVNKLASPAAQKKRPAANKSSYAIAAAPASVCHN